MTAHKFGKIILSQLLCLCAAFTACTDNDEVASPNDSRAPLQVSVNTSLAKQSRSIVHGEWLPDASTIGVSLFTPAPDYADYDGQGYYNIKYTASGEEDAQTWASTGVTPSISSNEAALVAYYPYSDAEDLDITAIPVEIATQTDYMYSTPVTAITNANPKANITLYHALTAIRVKLVLGNFTGSASVTDVTVSSPALASEATLNAYDGALVNIAGQGDKFTLTADYTLTTTGTDNDIMFVPDASVTSGTTTVNATIGGKKYTADIAFDEAYKQGYIYTYTLTLNNTGFEVTKVNVNPWDEGTSEDAVLEFTYPDDAYVVKVAVEDGATFNHNVQGFTGTIDWGDGTVDTYDTATDNPAHTYTTGSSYIVTARGNIPTMCSYSENITELLFIGEECAVTNMESAFYNQPLTYIAPGAMDGCTQVTDMGDCFGNPGFNGNLTSIPDGLFDKCTEVTNMSHLFCGRELYEIPEGLFDNCTKVTTFAYAFDSNNNIQTIPERLFDNCSEVVDFQHTFAHCKGLAVIPEGLFDKCTKVTSFQFTFEGCTGITSIPEGLFDNCIEVTSFVYTFYKCTKLTSIPEGLFDDCSNVTDFQQTFKGCTSLQSIPKGLFDKCTEVTSFYRTFDGCTSLTGESPYSTIQVDGVDTKVHLYERSLYPDYFTTPTSYGGCFYSCTGLTDYSSIPSGWK